MAHTKSEPSAKFQAVVDKRFTTLSEYWRDLYADPTVFGAVHQERHKRAIDWVQTLQLPAGARILDLGCGAGVQAVSLAEIGFDVDGLDPVPSMIELANTRATSHGVEDHARFVVGDAHALPYEDARFDLILALGVLPYLFAPEVAMREAARVLKPNGFLLLSSHNALRLIHLVDPRYSPVLSPVKELVHRLTAGRFRPKAPVRTFTLHSLKELLGGEAFTVLRWQSVGYGPFTILGRPILEERRGVRVHRRLQALADRGMPVLSQTGNQHLVLAQLQERESRDSGGSGPQ